MSKDRTKKILREIRALRSDLEARLDRIEARVDERRPAPHVYETEIADPEPDPFEPEVTTARVISPSPPATGPAVARPVKAPEVLRTVSVVIQPLVDLSLAKAVESSLNGTEGIEQATIRTLSGDSAIIDAHVDQRVSVVDSLRRSLPVAFDVTDSSEESVTIRPAHPSDEQTVLIVADSETDS